MRISESVFFCQLFDALNASGIDYAVMRNGNDLPATLNGSDLDIILKPGSIDVTRKLISSLAHECGGAVMGEISGPRFLEMSLLGQINGAWWGVTIDLCDGGYVWEPINGITVLKYKVMSPGKVCILHDDMAQLLGFAKELLMNRKLSIRYHLGAVKAINSGMLSVFSSDNFARFVRSCAESMRRPSYIKWTLLRIDLVLQSVLERPITAMANYWGYYASKARRCCAPCGHMMVIMGTDGAGKSTLIDTIKSVLNLSFHRSVVLHHLKPDLFPPLARFRGVKCTVQHVCSNPHASKPSGVIGSVARITYLMLDYVLGYLLKVRVRLAKLPVCLWVFDRYASDIIIDPWRFRINLPKWLLKMFLFLVPRPDLILCLGGDPEIIYSRKPETSLDEVRRQVVALRKFCDGNKRAVWIDTTTSVEESANAALRVIMNRLGMKGECP